MERLWAGIVYISLLLMAVSANSMLLLCFYRERGLSTNYWILINLAVANILSAITMNTCACLTIFSVAQGLCRVHLFFLVMVLYLTAYCNCFLSVNQSLQVLKFRYTWMMSLTLWLKRHLTLILSAMWVISMLVAIPVAGSHTLNVNSTSMNWRTVLNACTVSMGMVYSIIHVFLSDAMPTVIFLCSSLVLIMKLWKHKRQIQAAGLAQPGWRNSKEKRATKTVLMLIVLYVLVCNYALRFLQRNPSVWATKVITKTIYTIASSLIIIQGSSKMKAKISRVLQIHPSKPNQVNNTAEVASPLHQPFP